MPETNIINFSFPKSAQIELIHDALVDKGVLGLYKGYYQRFVTHVGLTREDIDKTINIINSTFPEYL